MAAGFAFLLWLVAFACFRAPGVATGMAFPRETHYLAITSAIGFVFSGLVYLAAIEPRRLGRGARVAVVGSAVIALLLIHAVIDLYLLENFVKARVVLNPKARVTGQGWLFLNNILTMAPVYVTYAIGVGLGLSWRAIHEREQRLAAALAAKQEAQLAALRLQINPHFLFNSLNAVMSLVGSDRNREAETVVGQLAAFFRATLSSEPDALVTLEEELEVLGAYLDIEAARFGDRLRVEVDLPDALALASLPHFLLQPLAENAIKHGVAPSKRPVTLTIAARARDGRLVVSVEDDGAGGAVGVAGAGVGLRNVAERLRAHYGENASFTARRRAKGFLAEAELPLTYAEREA